MLKSNNADRVIFAITCLHNYLLTKKNTRSLYTPFGNLDHETSDDQILPGTWREERMPTSNLLSLNRNGPKNVSATAKDVRKDIYKLFCISRWRTTMAIQPLSTKPGTFKFGLVIIVLHHV